MSVEVQMRDLLDAGVHFGHQSSRWNPKMRSYIYGERNGIHIIDLEKTQSLFKTALQYVEKTVGNGGDILFVATKKQAQEIVREEAQRAGMFFVDHRWLGGMLTNWQTVRKSITKLKRLEKMAADGTYENLPKKEQILKERLRTKLEQSLGGIKNMPGLPSAIFVIDAKKESIAILEAKRLGLPVIAVTDTNTDPNFVDYIIPGNDDSLKAIKLYSSLIADAAIAGRLHRKSELSKDDVAAFSNDDERGQLKVKRLKTRESDEG